MISLCLTNYNRFEFLIESFAQVIDDNRISEIIISDDASNDGSYEKLVEWFAGHGKVKLFQNLSNKGMSLNKKIAVELATNNTCILFDSDNVISPDYINALFHNGQLMTDKVINVPEWAQPDFKFSKYAGSFLRLKEAKESMIDPMFRCMMNCCNYVVNRQMYIDVYEYDETIKQADTIAFNYRWLQKGYCFYVVPGMRYFHRVHKQSGFLENIDYNMKQAKEFENKILQLSE
ncbi:MAG: glycosyltransferase family 2 protein [Bacteroidota bacterium]|nr:glycosyltransferase family 2 protein [Bacteroidota bacterium]